jgi:hypothetical protein
MNKDEINRLRTEGLPDAEIARRFSVSRQLIGQVAGPRRANPVLAAENTELSDSITTLVNQGYRIAEISQKTNIPIGKIRGIIARNKIDYSSKKLAKSRQERAVGVLREQIVNALQGASIDLDNFKTTDLITIDHNLYARAMRVGGIDFWREQVKVK